MDLSLLERAFALRDEARKASFGANTPDLSKLIRGGEKRGAVDPSSLLENKIASELMTRASAALKQANKYAGQTDTSFRSTMLEVLRAASTPLPVLKSADIPATGVPGTDKPVRKTGGPTRTPRVSASKATSKGKARVSKGSKVGTKKAPVKKKTPRSPR